MKLSSQPISTVAALEEEARVLAISLAERLMASAMSAEQKAAWAAIIPEMRLDQLSRFAAALDASVEKAAQGEIADAAEQYKVILEKYAAVQAQTDSDFMQGVAELVEDLRKAERTTL